MKQSYQNALRKVVVAFYEPIITRVELFRATRMWRKGVKATLAKYKEGGAPGSICSTTKSTRTGLS